MSKRDPATLMFPANEVPVDERGKSIDGGVADHFGSFEPAATGKDRQAWEIASLVLVEEVVAPFDGRSDGLLALRQVAARR
jgi:hypothetical protein